MKKSVFIALFIFVAAVGWILSGKFIPAETTPHETTAVEAPATEEPKMMQVQVRDIVAEPFSNVIKVTGRTKAARSVDLRAEVDGQVLELLADKGGQVKEGQVIARLDKKDRAARVTEMKEVVKQRSIEFNAATELQKEGFYPKTRLAQAAADLEAAKANFKLAELNLDKTEIRAPYDGVIGGRTVEIGDYVTIGNPLMTIVDLDPMKLTAFLSEKVVLDVASGASATAKLLNGDEVQGVVTFIAPVADVTTRTFPVEISLPNQDQKIVEGLTAEIRIATIEKQAYKVSPSSLTLNDAGQVGVKIVNEKNTVEFIPVTVLSDSPDHMWVTGLPEKSRLITVGQDFVTTGQVVEPVTSAGDGKGGLL